MSEASLGARHQRVQRLRRLLRQKSVRVSDRAFVVEGSRVIEVALASGASVEAAYFAPEAHTDAHASRLLAELDGAGVRCFALAPGVLERVADTTNPQPLCAVASFLDADLTTVAAGADALLVLADVRDPGNLGSALRSADAAGIDGVVCAGETVDLYNPKAVRASAGSLFRVPVARCPDALGAFAELRAQGLALVGASGRATTAYDGAVLDGRVAIVVGNEANGLDGSAQAAMDALVAIPMRAGAESLNVAMAATVLCFELARRRRRQSARPLR